MTLDEAIKYLEELKEYHVLYSWTITKRAIQIGIEAIKQIQRIRIIEGQPDICFLPGETSE